MMFLRLIFVFVCFVFVSFWKIINEFEVFGFLNKFIMKNCVIEKDK